MGQESQKLVYAAVVSMFSQDKFPSGSRDSHACNFVVQILADKSANFRGVAITDEVDAFLKAELAELCWN
jgi:hypothetical protein